MIPTFQARLQGTRVYNSPVKHDSSSIFGLVFHNDDTYYIVINFQLHGGASGFHNITAMNEDMEIFYMYEVTS